MKIDTSSINLSSSHSFIQTYQTEIRQEFSFSKVLKQKQEKAENNFFIQKNLYTNTGQWFEIIPYNGSEAVSLKNRFVQELEKIRQMLSAIMSELGNAGGAKFNLTGINWININFNRQPMRGLYEYEYRETRLFTYHEKESNGFSADGEVKTKDGRNIDFSFAMNLEREFFKQDQTMYTETGYKLVDPLIINLESSAPQLAQAGFSFDLDMDGEDESLSSLMPGTGLLSLDKNNNGIINDGSELFGPSTGNGFGELSQYDEDNNFWIDENDAVFDELTIWGSSDQGQMHLTKIKDAGIGAIYLASTASPFDLRDENNNLKARVKRSGMGLNEDGSAFSVQEMDWTV